MVSRSPVNKQSRALWDESIVRATQESDSRTYQQRGTEAAPRPCENPGLGAGVLVWQRSALRAQPPPLPPRPLTLIAAPPGSLSLRLHPPRSTLPLRLRGGVPRRAGRRRCVAMTMGMVAVAWWVATAADPVAVTITSTRSRTSSAASAGTCSYFPSAKRASKIRSAIQRTEFAHPPAERLPQGRPGREEADVQDRSAEPFPPEPPR
jgi:hypothetical protein